MTDQVRTGPGFSFGENWDGFTTLINDERVHAARQSVEDLLAPERCEGKAVMDIGCGSGLFTESFLRLGAHSVDAVDVDPRCVGLTRSRILELGAGERAQVHHTSILAADVDQKLPQVDLVYAWGSLHHTGQMWDAIECAAGRVRPGGILVMAIYNRHWTSWTWKLIKAVYNYSPPPIRRAMVWAYDVAGRTYNRIRRRELPLERGMDYLTDIRDWLGGHPYEYASIEEIRSFARARGWEELKVVPCRGMTGTNEFVFRTP